MVERLPNLRADQSRMIAIAWSLCAKSLENRYARSALGPVWLVLTPLAMMALYWCVFSIALGVTWPPSSGRDSVGYIVPFMAGFAVFMYLSDVASTSLNLFVARRNYVRKSPVPLWVLWLAGFMQSTLVGGVNLAILFGLVVIQGGLTLTGVLGAIPVILLIVLVMAGFSLAMSLIGPFAGDIANGMAVVLRFLFYGAPITYPLSIMPAVVQPWLWLNPLTPLVELLRETLAFGQLPQLVPFVVMGALGSTLLLLATWLYGRLSHAVRDVV